MKPEAKLIKLLKPKQTRAPSGLSQAGRRLWRAIQAQYGIEDAGGLSHLLSACKAADDIADWRAIVASEGATIIDRFGQKREHPLLSAISRAETTKRQALACLNLDIEPLQKKPGRPPGR